MKLNFNTKKKRGLYFKRLIAVGLVCFAFFLSFNKWQQWKQYETLQKQVNLLKQEEQNILAQNNDLEKSLELLSSDSSSEKIARMQLNLKKEGEETVVFIEPESQETLSQQEEKKSNFKLWWEYFFINNN